MRPFRRFLSLAILGLPAIARAQPAATITTGEQVVAAMHDRYAATWYHTLTFVQKSTWLNADGSESRSETWYEALSMPARLRIDRGDQRAGNGSLYANDSAYTFVDGKLTNAAAQRNALLILGFDVYAQPASRSLTVLREEGFDLTKFHRDSWQGQAVYVVGAPAGDTTSKQFWVDTDRLLFVRLLSPNAQRTRVQDIRFTNYVRRGGGWLAEQVQIWTGAARTFQEDYSDVRVDPVLDPALWDPRSWSTARPWRTASAAPAACLTVGVVPAEAPDSIPEALLDSLGTVNDPAQRGTHYVRNLVTALFAEGATPRQRQAAVERVCGSVVGGDRAPSGEGYYLIRLHGAETPSALALATETLRSMPGVAGATTLALKSVGDQNAGASTSSCYDGDPGGRFRTQVIKEMLASANPAEVSFRGSLGLGGVDSASVRVVTDQTVCAKVREAVDAASRTALPPVTLLVLRAGPRYVAFDPLGLTHAMFVVDTAFRFRSIVP